MRGGLDTTLRVLARSKNEAAEAVLLPALDSDYQAVQDGALGALLDRRTSTAQRQLLARWPTMHDRWKRIIKRRPGRMTGAFRDAILSSDPETCAIGCDAVLYVREYDLVPALINATEDESNPNADATARTLMELTGRLYGELASPRDYRVRRNPQLARTHVVTALEQSLERFGKHKRVEIVEAFLMLAARDNSTLKRILMAPHDPAYLAVVDLLSHCERSGVIRLALSFLDDPSIPSSAANVLGHRRDQRFLHYLFKKIGREPSIAAKANLKRLKSIPWITDDLTRLDSLDGPEQFAVVQMVVVSGMNRLQVFPVVAHLLAYGKEGGRRAAAAALAEFRGTEANQLAIDALDDPDPEVQATVLVQLRDRGIPGGLNRLIAMVDSPHAIVRDAARECLGEFSFHRFLAAFDMLEEDVRRSTGLLVRKIDPTTVPALREELGSVARGRRIRAMTVAVALDVVDQLEPIIIELLADEDHMVRANAAMSLGHSNTDTARWALRDALADRSVTVQEAAQNALNKLARRPRTKVAPSVDVPSLEIPPSLPAAEDAVG